MAEMKCTAWRGHKFEPRYDETGRKDAMPFGMGFTRITVDKIEDIVPAYRRIYRGDVCVRCGQTRLLPAVGSDRAPKNG